MALTGEPYWWSAAPPDGDVAPAPLPATADVAIVGAGYTGLSAALALARAGRDVVVLDAMAPGEGASTRSGGMVGSGHRLGLGALTSLYGRERALAVMREGFQALDYTTRLIAEENIDCAFVRCGRFRGAWTDAHYAGMAREIEEQRKLLGLDADIVAPADVSAEVATDRYRGGVIFNQHGGLHPALFHKGLLERAVAAGARVIAHTAVTGVEPVRDGVDVRMRGGSIRARDVLIATNGYAPGAGGERRGVVGVPSFLVATEEIGENRVRSLIPSGRMIVETPAAHCYYRASPDGKRIVLGGRAALHPVPPKEAATRLREYLVGLFPSLADVAITHAWSGNVAMTRSGHPSLGGQDRVWHAMGCNGSGVAMMPYLGWRAAQKILGTTEGNTAFDGLPYRPWPLRALYPLGMPLVS